MQNDFSKAMDFRHACKVFDEDKKIPQDQIHYILEAGRKSPSSFGMEPWKFLVITNEALKAKLRPECWDQVQITSCSHLVVLLAAIENAKPQSGIPSERFARRPLSQEQIDAYMARYQNHLKEELKSDEKMFAWTARQTYIALANMMTAAAFVGIDSCPIEGFEKEKVEEILCLDTNKWQVSALAAFGYRVQEQSKQLRLAFDDVIEFIS
ncbi:MAG: NAD(P)H-dependent oxidoreductase [Sulfurovum sp.]|nr:NAD(P)H-dependent oxidoreductase [Sulfurovum sp.]